MMIFKKEKMWREGTTRILGFLGYHFCLAFTEQVGYIQFCDIQTLCRGDEMMTMIFPAGSGKPKKGIWLICIPISYL